jgi:hypothetical protein|tara:strand:+ start:548 stop:721 length:174 start_codon:yes stop_codon:yes gene_type:complete
MLRSYTLEIRDREEGGNTYRVVNNKTKKVSKFIATTQTLSNGKKLQYLLDKAINKTT